MNETVERIIARLDALIAQLEESEDSYQVPGTRLVVVPWSALQGRVS